METIFTIKTEHLNRFDDEVEAVKLWQALLWAEAYRINLPLGNINITEKTKTGDGGIDADAHKPPSITTESSLFVAEYTGYQIKAGSSFKPWQKAEICKELFGKKSPAKESLGEMTRSCMDREGTYILVCFGHDLTSDQRKKTVGHLIEFLSKDCGYIEPKVDVWSRNNIISFFQPFPALSLRINHRSVKFQTHASWSNNKGMEYDYKTGQQQLDAIETLQHSLQNSTSHVRVIGEPGIGKTRLVLEATRDSALSPLVIYTQADVFLGSDLMDELTYEENSYQVILVIDECDPIRRSDIVLRFANLRTSIRLITIYNDRDNASEVVYLEVPVLSDLQVEQIIKQYGISSERANRWISYCSGSPRVAHIIGNNLRNNPDDMLRSPDSVNVWERYIAGREKLESDIVKKRYRVIRYLALFKRFGYGGRVQKEARMIQELIAKNNPNITQDDFAEIIHDLRQRKILQGEYTLYITPKLLHIKLWTEWWEIYGATFAIEKILTLDSPPLLDWFFEMFEYAATSETAMKTVEKLLAPDGPFQQESALLETESGARFFRYLGEVAPQPALRVLNNTIGKWDRDRLFKNQAGRRQFVWLLEKTVQWRTTFIDSAYLLLVLGEAENEPWSNNASTLFTNLFYLSRVPDLSPTEAPPAMRLSLLQKILTSDSPERRMLAITGCGNAMTERTIGTVVQRPVPFGPQPQLWSPYRVEELYEAMGQAWQILVEHLDTFSEQEREAAINILVDKIPEVGAKPPLDQMVIATVQKLMAQELVQERGLLKAIHKLLHPAHEYRLNPASRRQWEEMRDELLASDNYHDRVRRYVGLDVDRYGGEAQTFKHQQSLEILARESLENKEDFYQVIDWLVTSEVNYGYNFGVALAGYDGSGSLLSVIVNAQQKADSNYSFSFLTGYLANLSEAMREAELDRWATHSQMSQWIAEVERAWPMSQHSVDRLLALIYSHEIPLIHLRFWIQRDFTIFLTEETFAKLIEFLLRADEHVAIDIMLGLYETYFISNRSRYTLPSELTLQLLTHQAIVTPYPNSSFDTETSFYWEEIASEFVRLYPSKNLALSEFILEHMDSERTVIGHNYSGRRIWQMIFRQQPDRTWLQTVGAFDNPNNAHLTIYWTLHMWLRNAMSMCESDNLNQTLVSPQTVWSWVEGGIDERARLLASFIPINLESANNEYNWIRQLLIRYGQREDVRESLHSNFSSGSWTGPRSLHYIQKWYKLTLWKEEETDTNVLLWLDEHLARLEPDIESAKIQEERYPV